MTPDSIQLDPDQESALGLMLAGQNVCLTGNAGTGKSAVIGAFRERAPGQVAYLAPTGLAARSIEGSTIHRFFGFDLALLPPGYIAVLRADQEEIVGCVNTIVIDEISMVRSDVLASIDATLRHYAPLHAKFRPFGGKQVIVVGDFHQLPPVVKTLEDWQALERGFGGAWAFQTAAWAMADFQTAKLRQAHRQAADLEFVRMLDGIRTGGHADPETGLGECLAWINANARVSDRRPPDAMALCMTNWDAFRANLIGDAMLPGRQFRCDARKWGFFDEDEYPTEPRLEFRIGSSVMMVANLFGTDGDGYANGDRGQVVFYDAENEKAIVEFGDGRRISVGRFNWNQEKYRVVRHPGMDRPRLERTVVGGFSQLPFRLAYGVTVHKAQGLTLDRVHVALARGAFAEGQVYTALSRCRSLAGLSLDRPLRMRDVMVDPAVLAFSGYSDHDDADPSDSESDV